MRVVKVLPFRFRSKRFPNKIIHNFKGEPLIIHSIRIANSINIGKTILSGSIEDFNLLKEKVNVSEYNFDFIPTSSDCKCALDRLIEINNKLNIDYIISIPVDEPTIISNEINRNLEKVLLTSNDSYSFYTDFYSLEDAKSIFSAKIILNSKSELRYMSRSIIPMLKNGDIDIALLKKHVGVMILNNSLLNNLKANKNQSELEKIEGLEQLRIVEFGYKLKMLKIKHYGFGIDNKFQIRKLETRMECIQKQMK